MERIEAEKEKIIFLLECFCAGEGQKSAEDFNAILSNKFVA